MTDCRTITWTARQKKNKTKLKNKQQQRQQKKTKWKNKTSKLTGPIYVSNIIVHGINCFVLSRKLKQTAFKKKNYKQAFNDLHTFYTHQHNIDICVFTCSFFLSRFCSLTWALFNCWPIKWIGFEFDLIFRFCYILFWNSVDFFFSLSRPKMFSVWSFSHKKKYQKHDVRLKTQKRWFFCLSDFWWTLNRGSLSMLKFLFFDLLLFKMKQSKLIA